MHLLYPLKILHNHCFQFFLGIAVISSQDKLKTMAMLDFAGVDPRVGCRVCAHPPPQDDLRFSNTTGILQKKKLCGLLVLK